MLSESLTDSQPEDLLRHYFDGDRQASSRLLLNPRHQTLVERIARRQTRGTSVLWEDAAQSAHAKVLQALQAGKFRQGGINEFYCWAATVARFEIIDLVRRERYRNCASLDRPIPGTDVLLSETIADPFNLLDAVERSDLALRAIEAIALLDQRYPDRAYGLLWQGRVQGKHQTQIAAELGLTQGAVSKRWKELVRRVAETLELLDDASTQPSAPPLSSEAQQRKVRSRSQSQW
jgi:RNA polymerase sigma factor (sigma-70 family)